MAYKSLEEALLDLERAGMLRRVKVEVDPELEMPAIAHDAYNSKGPALLFERVKGSPFRAAANIFGLESRAEFLFRKTLPSLRTAIQTKADLLALLKSPFDWPKLPGIGMHALPVKALKAPVMEHECTLAELPQLKSWPEDGGAFLTLPQVFAFEPGDTAMLRSNVGMYRIQISGNAYAGDECGLHYQINRGIAKYHQAALERKEPLKVSIFLGGPPAHTLAAAMPMPDSIPEVLFAGILAGRAFRYKVLDGWAVSAEADFCILGEVAQGLKPEGPFGDHMGYYSARHDFPYLKVRKVYHKKDAIFPFTVVGRPPAEDTTFGKIIHDLVEPMVPVSVSGLHEMNAVDAAGVHPLLLALGSERFVPYKLREPMELHKIANGLLGFNQAALAKYLWIAAKEDAPNLTVKDERHFMQHVLERLHPERDLHFQTATTIDTLDYSGTSLNHGSKLVISAAGEPCRRLARSISELEGLKLPEGFSNPRLVVPGILAISAKVDAKIEQLETAFEDFINREAFPWVTLTGDSEFCAASFKNWLWVTFTRTDPARDIHGAFETLKDKHWSCKAPIIADARWKPHFQQPLTMPSDIRERAREILVNALKA